MKLKFAAALLWLFTVPCFADIPYRRANQSSFGVDGLGYIDERTGPDQWEVAVIGHDSDGEEEFLKIAQRRAAELCKPGAFEVRRYATRTNIRIRAAKSDSKPTTGVVFKVRCKPG